MAYDGQNEEMIFIHGKPLQVGSFDTYHYCMPDLRYFEMADVLENLLDKGIKSVDEISDNEEFILVYGKYDDDEEVIESDGTCDN